MRNKFFIKKLAQAFIFFSFFLFFFFVLPLTSQAAVLFHDEFNGNGELHTYNNDYELLTDFHSSTGTFQVVNDHVEATGYDPGYVYTAIAANNVCASIDFNWSGGLPTDNWTNIMLHSTPTNFASAFQVRDDGGIQQRWVYYNGSGSIYMSGNTSFDENQTHTLKACVNGTTITGFLDNNLLFTHENTIYSGGYMGFASQITTEYLDNFTITNDLNVPLLKQTSEPWQGLTYDSANLWSPSNSTINRWGCALTSAAMVLKYHGINKLPDGSDLNPDSLNEWLKLRKKGYVGKGWVNWLEISELSNLAKAINNITTFNKLEYTRYSGANVNQLTTDLNNGIPGILEVPGHFVVAKGITQNSFSINDPSYNRVDLIPYGNTFLNLGRFVPSNSDLSYIMVVTDPNVEIILRDEFGNTVGESFIQQALIDPQTGISANNEASMLLFPKPNSGEYTLELTANQTISYTAEILLYDQEGNSSVDDNSGILENDDTNTITLNFNKLDSNLSTIQKNVTFQSTKDDITNLFLQEDIKKEKLKNDLLDTITRMEEIAAGNPPKNGELERLFKTFERNISNNRGRNLSEIGYLILSDDISALRNTYLP